MEIRITVPGIIIAALRLFAAEKDMRNYLEGIALEIGRKETHLVATDGYMLGCFRVECEQPDIDAPLVDIIIPLSMLKPIKPADTVEIVIGDPEVDAKGKPTRARPVTLWYGGVSVSGKTMDDSYPSFWRRKIPAKVSGEPVQFDLRFMTRLAKAWSILHGSKKAFAVGIGYNGEDAALIDLDYKDFTGVIMPMRRETPTKSPSWVRGLGADAGADVGAAADIGADVVDDLV